VQTNQLGHALSLRELAGALADATGVQAPPDAIGRFLRKVGFTYKKRRWSRRSDAAQR
jgi:transposase